jgi:hypothetical protein
VEVMSYLAVDGYRVTGKQMPEFNAEAERLGLIFQRPNDTQLEELAAAREHQERRARVNNEQALAEAGITAAWASPPRAAVTLRMATHPIDDPKEIWIGGRRYLPDWHTRDPGKPRYTWRAALPVIGIWALVVVLAVCLFIVARALAVTP